jgi:hypothetical protein
MGTNLGGETVASSVISKIDSPSSNRRSNCSTVFALFLVMSFAKSEDHHRGIEKGSTMGKGNRCHHGETHSVDRQSNP